MAGRQKDELLGLLEQARELAKMESTAQQVILVKTAKGNVYHMANQNAETPADEDRLLALLRETEDSTVQAVVCLWQEGGVPDVPSLRFRRLLLELDPRNGDALLPLQGENTLEPRTLWETMPGMQT